MNMQAKSWLKGLVCAALAFMLAAPGYVFFQQRGLASLTSAPNFKVFAAVIFPLFGLYAFTLIFIQIMIGSHRLMWRKLFPRILSFHRAEGLFALTLAVIHPLLIVLVYGFYQIVSRHFIAAGLRTFVLLGEIAILLLLLAVGAAIINWRWSGLTRFWRYLHWLNYVVFGLVWLHSWRVGSDVQTTWLRWLWLVYADVFVAALLDRLWRGAKKRLARAQANY